MGSRTRAVALDDQALHCICRRVRDMVCVRLDRSLEDKLGAGQNRTPIGPFNNEAGP